MPPGAPGEIDRHPGMENAIILAATAGTACNILGIPAFAGMSGVFRRKPGITRNTPQFVTQQE